ncbi:hypothetical protein [Thaumasiovibrio subtropicus]|uniref:hypothetical protein n=1 Tax=Thaumasiovibrio subtropicus TaxID=1891207 RepID=UPI00131B06EA|nr:hypothetical protein [Thaumasiovibrio subtropicus]
MMKLKTIAALTASVLSLQVHAACLDEAGRFELKTLKSSEGDIVVVNDYASGLQWQHCPNGMTTKECLGDPKVVYTRESKDSFYGKAAEAFNATLDGKDQGWKTPDLRQLMSISDLSCAHGTNTKYFGLGISTAKIDEYMAAMDKLESDFKAIVGKPFYDAKAQWEEDLANDTKIQALIAKRNEIDAKLNAVWDWDLYDRRNEIEKDLKEASPAYGEMLTAANTYSNKFQWGDSKLGILSPIKTQNKLPFMYHQRYVSTDMLSMHIKARPYMTLTSEGVEGVSLPWIYTSMGHIPYLQRLVRPIPAEG